MYFCFIRLCRVKVLRILAMGYIAVVRGAPVLMLLMLLFYGLLARSGLEAVTVAIVAFSLHTAAHVAELLRAAC